MNINDINKKLYEKIMTRDEKIPFQIIYEYSWILQKLSEGKSIDEDTVYIISLKMKYIYKKAIEYEIKYLMGSIDIDGAINVENELVSIHEEPSILRAIGLICEEIMTIVEGDCIGAESTARTLGTLAVYLGLEKDIFIRKLAKDYGLE